MEIRANVRYLDQAQLAAIRAIAENPAADPEKKLLAEAVLDLDKGIRSISDFLTELGRHGAFKVTRG